MSENADKPHEATPRKLQKARDDGEVARSTDLNTFALYFGTLIGLAMLGPIAIRAFVDGGRTFLAGGAHLSIGEAGTQALRMTIEASVVLIAVPVATIAAAIALQRSAVWAPKRMSPKLSRVSPISGAKNKFGPNGLFEFAKSAIKMSVYGGMLSGLLWVSADRIAATAALPMAQGVALLTRLSFVALAVTVGVAGVLAVADLAWQRHSHAAKNRMSRQELTDEAKESDGDPQLKARRAPESAGARDQPHAGRTCPMPP